MSLERGICHFLDGVDSKILTRGEDYYRFGQVENIDWDGSHVHVEVSGSEEEPCLVELDVSENGEIEAWTCDCSYDWGPVCKHTVATLLAIQAEPPEEFLQKPQASKIDIRALLENAGKDQLAELVLEHCQEDSASKARCWPS